MRRVSGFVGIQWLVQGKEVCLETNFSSDWKQECPFTLAILVCVVREGLSVERIVSGVDSRVDDL
jgi:hypothetical protein